ncbi:hypothetical protein AVEN_229558-1, partial [Araneus ventricosus]
VRSAEKRKALLIFLPRNKKMSKLVTVMFLLAFIAAAYGDAMENFIDLFTGTACGEYELSEFNQAIKACGNCIRLSCSSQKANPLECGIRP